MHKPALLLVALSISGFVAGAFYGCGTDTEGTPNPPEGGAAGVAGSGGTEAGDAPVDTKPPCPSAKFIKPADKAKLTEADDADKDQCKNGFTYDIVVTTNAPDGTSAKLLVNNTPVPGGATTVSANVAEFKNIQLNANGDSTLAAQIGTDASCTVSNTINVKCAGVPTCSVEKPQLTATHPALNLADNVASPPNYQVAFEVSTSVEDGQPVSLTVDGSPTLVTTNAQGGKAAFKGVTLMPDGDHEVFATCLAKSGIPGTSAKAKYPVDSTKPDLTVTEPVDGKHFNPNDDADPNTPGLQFKVCGSTLSKDTLNLNAALPWEKNFCVGIGASSPKCVKAAPDGVSSGVDGGCLFLDCPGGAPFDLKAKITDGAGNPSDEKVVKGVSCTSNLPTVQIVAPTGGSEAEMLSDIGKRILAASMTSAPQKDEDGAAGGCQYTVVACTDKDGTATLYTGKKGGTLTKDGSVNTVAAQPGDKCPSGYNYVAKFAKAVLPQSAEDGDGKLVPNTGATEIVVKVTDQSQGEGASPPVDVWVDTEAPLLQPTLPNPLCGAQYQSTTPVSVVVDLVSTAAPVELTVTPKGGSPKTYKVLTLTPTKHAVFDNPKIDFALGESDVLAKATEPSGNEGVYPLQGSCAVKVGNPPVVTWTSPASGPLNKATDADANTTGWQGTLKVKVTATGCTVQGGSVQFSTDIGGNIGTPIAIDANGDATLVGATVPDGKLVKLTATTSSIQSCGVGSASLSLAVDVNPPAAATSFQASVKERRQTSFHLDWKAPTDNLGLSTYDVRWSKTAITNQAEFDAAQKVAYSGTPAQPGNSDGIDVLNLYVENGYYFAVAGVDVGGNRGPLVATGPATAKFNVTVLPSGTVPGDKMGAWLDGSTSFDGDAYSDLAVGTRGQTKVVLYRGGTGGYASTPSVTLNGPVGFGRSLAFVDLDSDGAPDLVVGSVIEQKAYVFFGKKLKALTFPATLASTDADSTISFTGSATFGFSMANVGDFNGDGAADVAIGAPTYNSNAGAVYVVFGVPKGGDAGTFPSNIGIPADIGSKVFEIKGDASLKGRLGWMIVGLDKFYSTSYTTFVASAQNTLSPPGAETNGTIYAFGGPPSGASVDATAFAKHTAIGGAQGDLLGSALAIAGNLSGTPHMDLLASAPSPTAGPGPGKAYLYVGSPGGGPFVTSSTYTNSKAVGGDRFGWGIVGGGFSGSSVAVSFLGDPTPDIVVCAFKDAGGAPKLYLVDGKKAVANIDLGTTADVVVSPLPNDWVGTSNVNTAVADLNGDGYGDMAFGELSFTDSTYLGRVVVLW